MSYPQRWQTLALALVALGGCSEAADGPDGQTDGDVAGQRALETIHRDPALQQEVLGMSFASAAERLGALRFEARSELLFSRGGDEIEQVDRQRIERDAEGNFHTVIDTPASQLEVYRVSDTVYVRLDKGHLRKKPLRDVDSDSWCELAYAGLAQTLEIFGPALGLGEPVPTRLGQREALRIPLGLRDNPDAQGAVRWQPDPPHLPQAPPARWRQLARPLDLRGSIWIDQQSGVVTRVDLEGRLEVADREVRPTNLKLRYEARVSDIGAVEPITPPKARQEYRRERPPHDLLGFFEDHLPNAEAQP